MRIYIIVFILPFLLLSCVQKKIVPLKDGLEIDKEKYTSAYTDKNVRIVVRANAWNGYPSDLPSYVMSLYLEVENKSSYIVEIELKDILLIDDKGNQYNVLEPKEVAEIAKSGSSVGVSIGFSYGTPYWGFSWLAGGPFIDKDIEDIINMAFIPGKVEPKARLKGFIYFQKLPDEVNRITLKLSYKIKERKITVRFPFKVEKNNGKDSDNNGNKEDR